MGKFRIKKNMLISGFFLVVLILALIFVVTDNVANKKSMYIIGGFILMIMLSTYSIIKDVRILSINKVIWYFCLLFMGIAPLCQYVSDYYPWNYKVYESEIESAQYITIIFYIIYFVFYNYVFNRLKTENRPISRLLCKECSFSSFSKNVIFILAIVLFLALLELEGFQNLFVRSENNVDIANSTLRFVVKKYLSAFPAMACALCLLDKEKSEGKVKIIILFLITFISNFPTTTPRYWMGTLFLGIFAIKFLKRVDSRKLDFIVIAIIVIIFPFFYIFKFNTFYSVMQNGVKYSGVVNSFNTVDYDAFSITTRAIRYVNENGITWGNQLLNIIFFFIPRGIWKSKPITTNTLIASSQGQTFTNVSCPFPAEGYVNFATVGIIVYAIVLALYSSFFDKVFWEKSEDGKVNLINQIYPFLGIIIFYVSRGPLQPSFIQTIAMILPTLTIFFFFPKKSKNTNAVNKKTECILKYESEKDCHKV